MARKENNRKDMPHHGLIADYWVPVLLKEYPEKYWMDYFVDLCEHEDIEFQKDENGEYLIDELNRIKEIVKGYKISVDRHIAKHGPCFACGQFGSAKERAHIHALQYGGSNKPDNLHLLCKACHIESETFSSVGAEQYFYWFKNKKQKPSVNDTIQTRFNLTVHNYVNYPEKRKEIENELRENYIIMRSKKVTALGFTNDDFYKKNIKETADKEFNDTVFPDFIKYIKTQHPNFTL
jgi:hypothetical protein